MRIRSTLPRFIGSLLVALATLSGSSPLSGAETSATPRLHSPVDGMEMTDVATYFRWAPLEGASQFHIQIASDAAFAKVVRERRTTNKGYHKNCWFPREVLAPGSYFWRVRAVRDGGEGPWSETFRVRVNADHPVKPDVVRTITPETPLFLMRSRAWDPIKHAGNAPQIIPRGMERTIVVDDLALASGKAIERAKQYQELGLDFVVWANRAQVSLSLIEYLFQNFTHCIGIAEGEHFSGMYWERGPEGNLSENDYVHRAWTLCGKYGRFYFFADGDGGSYRWPGFAEREREVLARYRKNIVLMFKTTNGDMALYSYGAMKGFTAAGTVENTGIWVDEWIWPCSGFGKLGEIVPEEKVWQRRRTVGTKECPWIYDIQMWLMGIASGSTTFHLESAHQWSPDGKPAKHYERVLLPFVRAVVERKLLPSRRAFLESIPLAVQSDPALATGKHGKQYTGAFAYLGDLYALRDRGDREFIPNESRHGILTLLPPKSAPLNRNTRVVPQSELSDVAKARTLFDAAHPRRFTGDAFMWECDGTVIVTNSNENTDRWQRYAMPLPRGPVQALSGEIGVHQYLVGKIAPDARSFWFQTNSEYPGREIAVALTCTAQPELKVTPPSAAVNTAWDAARKQLTLRLSAKSGAVEVELK
jgi:hypothetical protein